MVIAKRLFYHFHNYNSVVSKNSLRRIILLRLHEFQEKYHVRIKKNKCKTISHFQINRSHFRMILGEQSNDYHS